MEFSTSWKADVIIHNKSLNIDLLGVSKCSGSGKSRELAVNERK